MHRSLRFQLLAIVVLTVVTVLAISQWLDTRLTERALEQDMQERARLALRALDSAWERGDMIRMRKQVLMLVRGHREIAAIDIFRVTPDGGAEPVMTTRDPGRLTEGRPAPAEVMRLVAGAPMIATDVQSGATPRWRMAVPIRSGGRVVGAAQVELSLAEVVGLKRRIRFVDGVALVFAIVLLTLVLALFLERRVARPVAALVDGMERAERGELGARVGAAGGGELGFLADSFNRMLSRIEDLTAGLEARVRQATQDLAQRNRELRAANQQLWQAQLEIARGERLATLGQMAATIAHELGTPLNSVLGFTQLLRREQPTPAQAEKLAIVESQVQRMIETIRSVLDRTRDRELVRKPVAVAPLVTEALSLVSTSLATHGVVARSEVPPDLPPVPGDVVALRQVLLNLLTNAIDAIDGAGTIRVSAAVVPGNGKGGRRLELAVADSGHGMSADELRHAFEPFYTTKAPGRGTGIGLVIVDHIVRAHGGDLVVESAPQQGTTMRVHLPLEV
ncbi:MAG TPA: ATP-binding protein [Candidatus Binatia bacterium]|nr:ATP-binding protein [Candidatus Binatia bacterium]